jgi:predicted RNA-binding Zn-ribbon protein involved in translation (DUF1610 family)
VTDEAVDIPRQPETDDHVGVGLDVLSAPEPVTEVIEAEVPIPVPPQPVPAQPVTATVDESAVDVTCPSCGVVGRVYGSRRASGDFCRNCDYPLFWAVERVAPAPQEVADSGLRRLPGTAGRAALASLRCPACTEPNKPSAHLCVRCGADLRPVAPVVVVAEEPEIEPMPEPVRGFWPWWAWAVAVVTMVAALGTALLVLYA